MTRRQPISKLTAALVALALLATVASTGATAQATDGPAIRVTDGATTVGGNTTVDVVLTSAPDGLAGYYLDLTVESPDDGRVVDASYPEQFGLTSAPDYADGGGTVTLEAADLDGAVDPGATDVRLATVEIAGSSGDLSLSVQPRQFDDDEGDSFEPAAGSVARTTATGSAGATTPDGTANGPTTATSADGPLSPALAVIAVMLVAALGLGPRES